MDRLLDREEQKKNAKKNYVKYFFSLVSKINRIKRKNSMEISI